MPDTLETNRLVVETRNIIDAFRSVPADQRLTLAGQIATARTKDDPVAFSLISLVLRHCAEISGVDIADADKSILVDQWIDEAALVLGAADRLSQIVNG
jgi:hypothetical protein